MKCVRAHGATEYRYRSVGYIQWGRVGDGRTLYSNVIKKTEGQSAARMERRGEGERKELTTLAPIHDLHRIMHILHDSSGYARC